MRDTNSLTLLHHVATACPLCSLAVPVCGLWDLKPQRTLSLTAWCWTQCEELCHSILLIKHQYRRHIDGCSVSGYLQHESNGDSINLTLCCVRLALGTVSTLTSECISVTGEPAACWSFSLTVCAPSPCPEPASLNVSFVSGCLGFPPARTESVC